MTQFGAVLEQLKGERSRLEGALRQVDQAVKALTAVTNNGVRSSSERRGRRRMSAAARARISAAQKARWAKVRAKAKRAA